MGSEVTKKERTKRECQVHSGRRGVQQKARKKRGERATQDYFQHQSQASYLCTRMCKHTVSTIHTGSHNILTPNSDLHTQVHAHCEHSAHRFTYYTHSNFRPLYTCTHMCMFSYEHIHIQIHTAHSDQTQASAHKHTYTHVAAHLSTYIQ